jgi:hypothetical protein
MGPGWNNPDVGTWVLLSEFLGLNPTPSTCSHVLLKFSYLSCLHLFSFAVREYLRLHDLLKKKWRLLVLEARYSIIGEDHVVLHGGKQTGKWAHVEERKALSSRITDSFP